MKLDTIICGDWLEVSKTLANSGARGSKEVKVKEVLLVNWKQQEKPKLVFDF